MNSFSVIKNRMHQTVAESIMSEIRSGQSRWYYFLGKSLPNTLEQPSSSLTYEAETRADIVVLSLIEAGDVSFVLPRVDWIANTVYNIYDDIEDENLTNFYVLDTITHNVYKCLDNNYRSISIIRPTRTDIEPFVTSDGYKWKFMYNIGLSVRNKFLTESHMPVSNSLNNRFFSDGGIEIVTISQLGANYTQETTRIDVIGDGTGAVLLPVISSGQLVDVIISNPGTGYTFAKAEIVSSRNISLPAKIDINLSQGDLNSRQALTEILAIPGTIDTILVTFGGSGYTAPPTVTVLGDGTGCTATAVIHNGIVVRINVTNPGSNYTHAEVIISGSATGRVIVSPPKGHGRDAITELHAKTLMFYGNIDEQKVLGFNIKNDYRQLGIIRNPRTLAFSSRIVNTISRGHYGVTGLTPINLGDYPIGSVVVDIDNNEYTVVSTQRNSNNTGGLVLFSPFNKEILAGTTLRRVNSSLSFIVNDVQDRQTLVARTATAAYIITPESFNPSLYPVDTILTNGGKNYTVIANDSTRLMVLSGVNDTIAIGDILNIKGTNTQFRVLSSIEPMFNRISGDILFINNRTPFTQTGDQAISFRTIIQY